MWPPFLAYQLLHVGLFKVKSRHRGFLRCGRNVFCTRLMYCSFPRVVADLPVAKFYDEREC